MAFVFGSFRASQVESHKDGLVSPSMYIRIVSLLRQIVFAHTCRMTAIFFFFNQDLFQLHY